ncbi:MAG: class I SAM-dependent methyltransferase [Candidatus Riflebacteria bacterium]|nr:class I SAM-dependent methyltransferase [Candidatus Riflebacteria bacterium]
MKIESNSIDNTKLFSGKVEDYQKFRPHYPQKIAEFLKRFGALNKNTIVADIAAGTGIVTRLMAGHAKKVIAIEPNQDMLGALATLKRDATIVASADLFSKWENVIEILQGVGEKTGLADHSVDLITLGSAFHWLDADAAKIEFSRILKPEGYVAILYHERDREEDAFQKEIEEIQGKRFPAHREWWRKKFHPRNYRKFFGGEMITYTVPTPVEMDLPGFTGLIRSTSSHPKEDSELRTKIELDMKEAFGKYKKYNGMVDILYQATVYLGRPH